MDGNNSNCNGRAMQMLVSPIEEMTVFDTANSNDRTQRTLFSLRIDGKTVYSKSIFGSPKLNSGVNTVGAFQNESKESLFAWIDPVSGEFLVTTDQGTFRPHMVLPGVAFTILTALVLFSGVWPSPDMRILAIPVLIGALVAISMKKRCDHKVELTLRSELKTI